MQVTTTKAFLNMDSHLAIKSQPTFKHEHTNEKNHCSLRH